MLRRPILGAVVSLVLVLLALILFTARYVSRAQPSSTPRADYEAALWVAATDSLWKLATVADHVGNRSAEVSVHVTIDTTPPAITLTTPADGTLTPQVQQTFVGQLSEAARLTLNGQSVSVQADLTFLHGPLTLVE
ncbi:MAG: hypothetical protein ACREOH_18470, partial [Candidatus Entotheonellia bacterium]